jgi:hypothetical protein
MRVADALAEGKPGALPRPSWGVDGDAIRSAALERARTARERRQPRRRPPKGDRNPNALLLLRYGLVAPPRWPLGQRSPRARSIQRSTPSNDRHQGDGRPVVGNALELDLVRARTASVPELRLQRRTAAAPAAVRFEDGHSERGHDGRGRLVQPKRCHHTTIAHKDPLGAPCHRRSCAGCAQPAAALPPAAPSAARRPPPAPQRRPRRTPRHPRGGHGAPASPRAYG